MTFHIIIPARFSSTRLPGKVLLDIAGKPMLQHVYERACESAAQSVVIATDDEKVRQAAEKFGAKICMTSAHHQSGTERIAEAIEILGYQENEIVVNVQGDEPLIPPTAIQQAAKNLNDQLKADVATLCARIESYDELFNPHITKVVMNQQNFALYFSRAPIAWDRDAFAKEQKKFSARAQYYRHIGLYAYRVRAIKQYVNWSSCYLEQMEALEQLRILWHGGRIHVAVATISIPSGIDTERDLEIVRKTFL